ncbi:MAG: archease [Halobacteriota archaeon]
MLEYEFVEHTADLTFKACGRDLNQLFENAAQALESTLIMLESVALTDTATIDITADSYEDLLYDWLAELFVAFEVNRFAVKKCIVNIAGLSLNAECWGERIDLNKHALNTEVKAVTYHNLQIKKNDVYHAEITLDV